MPSPKVFVSSTCYDLGMAREQIRSFLVKLGYEPIMSEYSDVLYDPRTHTHTSCLQEVPNTDMVVLLIGSRFGGKIIPEALSNVDLENLSKSSFDITILDDVEKLSVTQLETLKAIDASIPVFAFVDDKVMHDHLVYQKNKDLIGQIKFPSIEKPESAKYIFEFISFLQHRNTGNSVISFGKLEDIENHLRKQWASLFQRLLREQREKSYEERKMFTISEQIEELKTAMISTIGNAQTREIARGVIKYRRLSDFLSGLKLPDFSMVTQSNCSFEDLLNQVDVIEIHDIPDNRGRFGRSALVKSNGTFYELRFGQDFLSRLSNEWQSFIALPTESRRIIIESISDIDHMGPGVLRYRSEQFSDYFSENSQVERIKEMSLKDFIADQSKVDTKEQSDFQL